MEGNDEKSLLTPPVSSERDHVRGPARAPLVLLEYGDYACGFCTRTHPVIEALREELTGRLRFAYRHFPVSSPSRSRPAAEAAEAAGAQGAFWAMHDALTSERGVNLSRDRLGQLAEAVGLDTARFRKDLQERAFSGRIREDYESARASGVEGTPALFVGRRRWKAGTDAGEWLQKLQLKRHPRASVREDLERLTGLLQRSRLD